MVQTTQTLLYLVLLYGTLTWYFDKVGPGNRGVPLPWYFPFMLSYWCPCLSSKSDTFQLDAIVEVPQGQIDTARNEKNEIVRKEHTQQTTRVEGIRAMGLSKTYTSSLTGSKTTEALKNVYFEIKKGELLGVMGHNGAGKSTLINVLCGLVDKQNGNARLFDFNIEDELNKVRKRMGVVSQFDVLWDELTGIEHMYLF